MLRNATDSAPQAQHQNNLADVIILGAGISGLACAAALQKAGLRVILLEARHRIGGRLHTLPLPAGPTRPPYTIDLGGAWVHGIGSPTAPNALYKLARELHLTTAPTDYDDAVVYDAVNGQRLPEATVADMESIYHSFEQHLLSMLSAPEPRPAALQPIATAAEAFASSNALCPRRRALLGFALSTHMEHYWAGEAGSMGVAALEEEVLPGGDVVLGEGYGPILARLAAGQDVRLGHEVVSVQYGVGGASGGGVVVSARVMGSGDGAVNGGGGGGPVVRYGARAAVVTLPVAVMRGGGVSFDPPLEAADPAKAAAIRGLGAAVYNKVVLLFEQGDVFWDDVSFIYRIPAPHEAGRWSYFLNLHKVTGAPILVGFNLGTAAAALETASDQETVASVMTALAGMYGAARVRQPRSAVVTRWGSDPYSRMSYSYIPAGFTCAAFDDVARPLFGSLFFAGEATHRRHYGTAHGAYDSGRLAAAAVVQGLAQRQRQRVRQVPRLSWPLLLSGPSLLPAPWLLRSGRGMVAPRAGDNRKVVTIGGGGKAGDMGAGTRAENVAGLRWEAGGVLALALASMEGVHSDLAVSGGSGGGSGRSGEVVGRREMVKAPAAAAVVIAAAAAAAPRLKERRMSAGGAGEEEKAVEEDGGDLSSHRSKL